LVLFADAEDVVGTWLQDAMAAHGRPRPVSTLAPDDDRRPTAARGEYVRIEVVGGARAGLTVEDVTLVLESYADTAAAAIATAEFVRALINAGPGIDGCPLYAVTEMSRPQSLPDPRTGLVRYTQTVNVRLRAVVI
jgi:hypothetical protein